MSFQSTGAYGQRTNKNEERPRAIGSTVHQIRQILVMMIIQC